MGDRIVLRTCSGSVPASEFPHPGEPFVDMHNYRFGIGFGEDQPRWYPAIDVDGNLDFTDRKLQTETDSSFGFDENGFAELKINNISYMTSDGTSISITKDLNVAGKVDADSGDFQQGLVSHGIIDNFGPTTLRGPVTILGPLNLSLSEFASSVLPQGAVTNDILTAGVGPGGAHDWKKPGYLLENSTLASTILAVNHTPGWIIRPINGLYSVFREGYPANSTMTATLDDLVTTSEYLSYVRASTAGVFNIDGNYLTAAINKSRVDYDFKTQEKQGLILEGPTQNSITNSAVLLGAKVGQVNGASPPGSLPNGWSLTDLSANSVVRVLAIEEHRGLPSIVVRFQGSNSSGSDLLPKLHFISGTTQATVTSEPWSTSVFSKIESATQPPLNIYLNTVMLDGDSTNAPIVSTLKTSSNLLAASAAMDRFSTSVSTATKTNSFVNSYLSWPLNNGQTLDFTIRIMLPILEKAAKVTSPFNETIRSGDLLTLSAGAQSFNSNEGTVFISFKPTVVSNSRYGLNPVLWRASKDTDGTVINDVIHLIQNNDHIFYQVYVGGVAVVNLDLGQIVEDTQYKIALTYKRNNFSAIMTGNTIQLDTVGEVPPISLNGNTGRHWIGSDGVANFLPIKLLDFRNYRRKLSDSEITSMVSL